VTDLEALAREIERRGLRTDVYVGCGPRLRRAGTKDAVDRVWVLWAECDGPEAVRAARRFSPSPSVIVSSGSGANCHAYWPLSEPLEPREAEMANLRLARELGADVACFDAGRILRPPGTWNHKHEPARPVVLIQAETTRRHRVEDVVGHLPELTSSAVARRWDGRGSRHVDGDLLLRLAPRVYVEELLGHSPNREGKITCPFHRDEHPSLHVYKEPERGWTCFACGRGGSIYDLAAAVWGRGTRGREFIAVRDRLRALFRSELGEIRPGEGLEREPRAR
jgi:hypothetical protein